MGKGKEAHCPPPSRKKLAPPMFVSGNRGGGVCGLWLLCYRMKRLNGSSSFWTSYVGEVFFFGGGSLALQTLDQNGISTWHLLYTGWAKKRGHRLSVFENTNFSFFSDLKKTWLFTFFEMAYQKVVKSHQQKFSPQYVTKVWPLRSMITVIQFLAPKSHCWTFWLIGSIGRNKITNATKAAVVGLPGSKRWVGTLGSVRFWQQWRGSINLKQPYIRVSKLNIWLDYDANITQ